MALALYDLINNINKQLKSICCKIDTISNGGAGSYKVYTALLNQSGINPPTAEVLENTFGGAVTFEYIQPGIYGVTFPIVSPREKVWISLTNNKYGENAILQYEINGTPISGFVIHTSKFTLGSPTNISLANDCLEYASIEIRVYN
jgi:hypothetical protein